MPALLPSLLVASWSAASACADHDGWRDGLAARAAAPACRGDAYVEAHRLGRELRSLRDEHARLAQALETLDATERGAAQRRMRQIDVDVEALLGLATVRGWAIDLPADATR